jgi:hypothetical protein
LPVCEQGAEVEIMSENDEIVSGSVMHGSTPSGAGRVSNLLTSEPTPTPVCARRTAIRPPPSTYPSFPAPETRFYEALLQYLRDGYNLAAARGGKGRALGFVMTIFQKIAASSFAAVGATLRRRLLSLTVHEAIVCDQNLDVDGRERALSDARRLIHEMYDIPADPLGKAEEERLLADSRVKLLRRLGERFESEAREGETQASAGEESAAMYVSLALPEEPQRI